jgi:hypothetical protein
MGLKDLAKAIQTENEVKPIEQEFLNDIDKFLVTDRAMEDRSKTENYIRPSMFYKCVREQWYKYLKAPCLENRKAKGLRTLEIGTALHEWVQREIFMKEGFPAKILSPKDLYSSETEDFKFFTEEQNKNENRPEMEIGFIDKRWTKKYFLYSILDGVLEYKDLLAMFEFKTINPNDFKYLYEPLSEHKMQAALYSLSLKIQHVFFLYLNKGNSEWKLFLYKVTPEQTDWCRERVITIENSLVNLKIPDREGKPLTKEASNKCVFCPYKKMCEVDLVPEKPKKIKGFNRWN